MNEITEKKHIHPQQIQESKCIAIFLQDLALVTVSGLVAGSLNTTVLIYYSTDQLLNELAPLEAVLKTIRKKIISKSRGYESYKYKSMS